MLFSLQLAPPTNVARVTCVFYFFSSHSWIVIFVDSLVYIYIYTCVYLFYYFAIFTSAKHIFFISDELLHAPRYNNLRNWIFCIYPIL